MYIRFAFYDVMIACTHWGAYPRVEYLKVYRSLSRASVVNLISALLFYILYRN